MGHTGLPDEGLEVLDDERRAFVGNHPGIEARKPFIGSLQHGCQIARGHRLAQVPVGQETAVSVQHRDQVANRAAEGHAGHVGVPMLVGP